MIEEQWNESQYISGQHEMLNYSHLFSKINTWEQETIIKIRQAAKTVRDELQQLLDQTKNRMLTMSPQLNEQLHKAVEQDTYEEFVHQKERLNKIREELQTSLHVDIVTDYDRPPIYFLKLKTMEKDIVIQSRVTSTRSNDSFENIVNDQTEIEFESHFLDPIKNNNLILLQISTSNESQLSTPLRKLHDGHLSLLYKTDAWITQLKLSKQSTLIIDMFNMSLKDQDNLLSEISQLAHIRSVYIRGTPPEADDDRQYFFSKYPIIKAMFEHEQSLIVQWAMDTANEYKKIGDMYIEKGEKDLAQQFFVQGVALYKRLSTFLNEERYIS